MRVGRSGARVSAPGKEQGGRGWGGQAGIVTREKSGLYRGRGVRLYVDRRKGTEMRGQGLRRQ